MNFRFILLDLLYCDLFVQGSLRMDPQKVVFLLFERRFDGLEIHKRERIESMMTILSTTVRGS